MSKKQKDEIEMEEFCEKYGADVHPNCIFQLIELKFKLTNNLIELAVDIQNHNGNESEILEESSVFNAALLKEQNGIHLTELKAKDSFPQVELVNKPGCMIVNKSLSDDFQRKKL
eukprot:TRINITY_DN3758_c0_g1_i1.p1 TRINITY_DN3758_c0_g1~~TRINITY_DN3758_c0_g1_i1.p1  ORF type:complete len:115 (-),score=41.74 TRINITY_DN3758_c0_g1_i1:8-352(-)